MIGYGVASSTTSEAASPPGISVITFRAIRPVNAPGAGSPLLANQITNTQPKDGTVIGLISRSIRLSWAASAFISIR
jgi:hypothetical protein